MSDARRLAAFPVAYGPDGQPGYSEGMSLRDYFAGQALAGWGEGAHAHSIDLEPRFEATAEAYAQRMARFAYMVADAMIAEGGRAP